MQATNNNNNNKKLKVITFTGKQLELNYIPSWTVHQLRQ